MARSRRRSSRTSPMNQRSRLSSATIWRSSYCLSSSREKTTSRRGSRCLRAYVTNALPNDPVPPVTRMLDPCRTDTQARPLVGGWLRWRPTARMPHVRILIHCHGGPAIGVGHVFRSAALAEVALDRGHRVEVTGRLDGALVTDRLAAAGVEVVAAPVQSAYDVVHLDTYEPDGDEVARRVAGSAGAALVSNLEDGDFGRRPADLVVDPNLGAERTAREDGPVLLGGWRGAPLRRSVAEKAGAATVRPEAQRILVVMGGTDVLGLTGQVLELLAGTGRDLAVTA